MRVLKERLIYYGEHSSIHGLRYIAASEYNWPTRVFWTSVIILSTVGMFYILNDAYVNFLNHAVSFATETTYLDWNTTFPAISICEIWYKNKFWKRLESVDVDIRLKLQQHLSEIAFFRGIFDSYSQKCDVCTNYKILDIKQQFRTKCQELLKKCKWNGMEFDCCEQFLPLETEYGLCFTINSFHTRSHTQKIHLVSNIKTGPGKLEINTYGEDFELFLHSPEDVPYYNSELDQRHTLLLGENLNILFQVIEISNDNQLKSVSVRQRECLFPDELPPSMKLYNFYSYSTCIVQCHAYAHLRICNCSHHLMPPYVSKKYCDEKGLACLVRNFEMLSVLSADKSKTNRLICDCMPSCTEPEYKIIYKGKTKIRKATEINVNIEMQSLPSQRFRRNVVRSQLDLVVSIGGTIGLFFGGSVLSIIEIIYFFIIRTWNKNIKAKKLVKNTKHSIKASDYPVRKLYNPYGSHKSIKITKTDQIRINSSVGPLQSDLVVKKLYDPYNKEKKSNISKSNKILVAEFQPVYKKWDFKP